jgi:predicted GTPase
MPMCVPNIVVFGETGAGKSSILNMLEGGEIAVASDGASGTTFASAPYEKSIKGSTFRVFDTAGLNGALEGTVPPREAIDNLYRLICRLKDGVNLLVYVMRGARIVSPEDYKMFFEGLCRKKVPIVMIVSGLEARGAGNMDVWWEENKPKFDSYQMSFSAVACITATKGKFKLKDGGHTYEKEYEESKRKVEDLIHKCHARTPWKMSMRSWFFSAALKLRDIGTPTLGFEQKSFTQELRDALQSHGELPKEDAIAAFSTKLPHAQRCPPNVIVFGESGAGKSSILNMLEGDIKAPVSDRATGVTFQNACYKKMIGRTTFSIFDTVGLNEGSAGTVTAKDAVEGLYRLIHQLDDGVNLLVYVMRASRVTRTTQQNYEMFFDVFCRRKVPIVIVITGLENRTEMDKWWEENKATFDNQNMAFSGHACITATEGKQKDGVSSFGVEYEDSKWEVESLILRSFSIDPWKLPTESWFTSVAMGLHNIFATVFGFKPKVYAHELCQALQTYGGLSYEEAMAEAKKIASSSRYH